jgi:hypothetical protein
MGAVKEKHIPTDTFDCPFCGATWWIKVGDSVPCCDCGFALVKRHDEDGKGEFVLYLQLCRLDEDGIVTSIDELRDHTFEE